jgi:hypothetical protein
VIVDGLEKGDVASKLSGAVARRGVSGRRVVLLSIIPAGFTGVFTTSRVGGAGVEGGSETSGTMLRTRCGNVNTRPGLNERLQASIMVGLLVAVGSRL